MQTIYQKPTAEQELQLRKELVNIEKDVVRLDKAIHIGNVLTDLKEDSRYKEVFDEYYLKDEVIRTTMLLSEKYFMEEKHRQSLEDSLISYSHFNDWVNATVSMELLSSSRLEEHRQRKEEINQILSSGYLVEETEVISPEGE